MNEILNDYKEYFMQISDTEKVTFLHYVNSIQFQNILANKGLDSSSRLTFIIEFCKLAIQNHISLPNSGYLNLIELAYEYKLL